MVIYMNNTLQDLIGLILSFVALIVGVYGVFFPEKVRDFYLKTSGTGYAYRRLQRLSKKKWFLLNLRISGVGLIIFGLIGMAVIIHSWLTQIK
jgi:preprotein translocase subunit Sss1